MTHHTTIDTSFAAHECFIMPQEILIPAVSFDELLRNKTHKATLIDGRLHIVNLQSGHTEYILKKNYNPAVQSRIVPKTINDRTVMVEEDLQSLALTARSEPPYSEILIDLLCERIALGASLTAVCSEPDMPSYSTLCRWRRTIDTLQERIDQARADRAETLRDKAMREMDNCDEDNVASSVAKHKALVWAAGADDPNRYSPKAKLEATISQPTQILVYTGVNVPKPAVIEEKKDGQ